MKKSVILLGLIMAFCFAVYADNQAGVKMRYVYKLHGQTRKFDYTFVPDADGGITLTWGIERNLKWWSGTYRMTPASVESGTSLSYRMPEDGNHLTLDAGQTFAMISKSAFNDLKQQGSFVYDGVTYTLTGEEDGKLGRQLNVKDAEGANLSILDNPHFPLIIRMSCNPLEINWTAE